MYFVNTKQLGIQGVLLGNVYASSIMLILSAFLLKNQFSIKEIDFSIMGKIIKFALPFLPAAIFTIIMEGADRFILKYMIDEATVGIYSAGYKLGIFGLLIVMAFNMGWTPYFLKHNKQKKSNSDYSIIPTLLLGLYGFTGIILTALLPQIQYIKLFGYTLIGTEYFNGLSIAPIILMSYYFLAIYILMLPRIYKYDQTPKIVSFRLLGALTNIILNLLLIPKFGIMGSAFSTLFSFAIMSYYIFNIGNRLEYIKYNLVGWVFPLLIWAGVTISIMVNNNYLITVIMIIFYPILWYKFIINSAERETLLGMIR